MDSVIFIFLFYFYTFAAALTHFPPQLWQALQAMCTTHADRELI